VASGLARAVCAQGRFDEAEELARVREELARPLDVAAQVSWRSVRGACLAGRGELAEAEAVARDALRAVEQTDDLNRQARVLVDLAEIVARAGREDEASALRERALALFERRGNIVGAEGVRARLHERAQSPQ